MEAETLFHSIFNDSTKKISSDPIDNLIDEVLEINKRKKPEEDSEEDEFVPLTQPRKKKKRLSNRMTNRRGAYLIGYTSITHTKYYLWTLNINKQIIELYEHQSSEQRLVAFPPSRSKILTPAEFHTFKEEHKEWIHANHFMEAMIESIVEPFLNNEQVYLGFYTRTEIDLLRT